MRCWKLFYKILVRIRSLFVKWLSIGVFYCISWYLLYFMVFHYLNRQQISITFFSIDLITLRSILIQIQSLNIILILKTTYLTHPCRQVVALTTERTSTILRISEYSNLTEMFCKIECCNSSLKIMVLRLDNSEKY